MKVIRPANLERLNSLEVRFLDGGEAHLDPSWQVADRQPPYSRLYYLYEGTLLLEWQGGTLRMEAGGLYLLPAGLSFSATCAHSARKFYFHLQLLRPDGYDAAAELPRPARLPLNPQRTEQLRRWINADSLQAALALKNMLTEDLLAFFTAEQVGEGELSRHSPMVLAAMQLIRRRLSAQLSVREVAERLYVSERTLTKAFRRELGQTPGRYIDEMLFMEACRRLLLTDRPIGEISEQLGFCDQFYFSRRFRARSGKSPSAYRREGALTD